MASIHTARFNARQKELGMEMVCVWLPSEARAKFEFEADEVRVKYLTALIDEGSTEAIALMAAKRRVLVKTTRYEDFIEGSPRFMAGGSGFKQGSALYSGYHDLCDLFSKYEREAMDLERHDRTGNAWRVPAARAYIVSQQIKRYEQRVKEYIAAERTHATP